MEIINAYDPFGKQIKELYMITGGNFPDGLPFWLKFDEEIDSQTILLEVIAFAKGLMADKKIVEEAYDILSKYHNKTDIEMLHSLQPMVFCTGNKFIVVELEVKEL